MPNEVPRPMPEDVKSPCRVMRDLSISADRARGLKC